MAHPLKPGAQSSQNITRSSPVREEETHEEITDAETTPSFDYSPLPAYCILQPSPFIKSSSVAAGIQNDNPSSQESSVLMPLPSVPSDLDPLSPATAASQGDMAILFSESMPLGGQWSNTALFRSDQLEGGYSAPSSSSSSSSSSPSSEQVMHDPSVPAIEQTPAIPLQPSNPTERQHRTRNGTKTRQVIQSADKEGVRTWRRLIVEYY